MISCKKLMNNKDNKIYSNNKLFQISKIYHKIWSNQYEYINYYNYKNKL